VFYVLSFDPLVPVLELNVVLFALEEQLICDNIAHEIGVVFDQLCLDGHAGHSEVFVIRFHSVVAFAEIWVDVFAWRLFFL
jgi:hypothetical protein